MKMLKTNLLSGGVGLLVLLTPFVSCSNKKTDKNEIMKADTAFSNHSLKYGMKEAFYLYAADNAIMLRPNSNPIIGKEQIKKLLAVQNDSLYEFTWKPLDASVAKSGDLGYSYGIYQIKFQDSLMKGTYVSIWKKNEKGEWKFVLDSGNEGLGK